MESDVSRVPSFYTDPFFTSLKKQQKKKHELISFNPGNLIHREGKPKNRAHHKSQHLPSGAISAASNSLPPPSEE